MFSFDSSNIVPLQLSSPVISLISEAAPNGYHLENIGKAEIGMINLLWAISDVFSKKDNSYLH